MIFSSFLKKSELISSVWLAGWLGSKIYMSDFTAVITIKHVSTFVNKVENPYVIARIFDLIDNCR
jgi:hypothetical protein